MKNNIMFISFSIGFMFTNVPVHTSAYLQKKAVQRCIHGILQVASGGLVSTLAFPLLGISLISLNVQKLANQKPSPFYELSDTGKKIESGQALYLCEFLIFVKNGENYVPFWNNNNTIHPISGPISQQTLPTIDKGVSVVKKTGFGIGVPLLIIGTTTLHKGIKNLKKGILFLLHNHKKNKSYTNS